LGNHGGLPLRRLCVAQAAAATVCFSTGAILVRWAGELSPVEVTSPRMLLGAGFVGLAAWTAREPLGIPASEWVRLIPIGLVAALHFLLAWLLLGEPLTWNVVAGAVLPSSGSASSSGEGRRTGNEAIGRFGWIHL